LGLVFRIDGRKPKGGPGALETDKRRRAFAQAQAGVDAVERQEIGELLERERPVLMDRLPAGAGGRDKE